MGDIIQLRGEVSIQAAADGSKAPRVEIVGYTGGLMSVPGWGRVAVDLKGLDIAAQVPILSDHDSSLRGIVGHGQADIRAGQLIVTGDLPQVTDAAKQIVELARGGFQFQASVGVQPSKQKHIAPGSKATVNGKAITADAQGFTLVRAGSLKEISIVALGADSETSVAIAAHMKRNQSMSDENSTPAANIQAIQETWQKATFHDPGVKAQAQDIMFQAMAGTVTTADFQHEMVAAQLRDRELKILRAERPAAPTIQGSSRDGIGRQSPTAHIEGALLCHLGHEAIGVKTLGAQTMEQARGLHANSLLDIIRCSLQAEGREVPTGRDSMIRAAFSTHSLTTLLTTAANKLLLDSYTAFPSAARQIAKKLSANDFKAHTGFRLTGDSKMLEIGSAGEIKHGTLGQASYPFSVKTFARMFALTRQDIINDDLGAFDSVPQKLGRGAALAIEEALFTLLLANTASFFHADNNNLSTTSALAEAGLNSVVQLLREQTDEDGTPIMVTPKFLVVPPALEMTAKRLMGSATMIMTGDTDAARPSSNSFYGLADVLVTPFIGSGVTNGSDSSWYLFGSPSDVAAFGIAFLAGQEAPTIESADADFNTLGMNWRGYLDFGCCQVDPRGAVMATT